MNSDMSLLSSLASQRDLVDMDMANVDLVQLMQINNGGHLMGTLETVAGGDPDMAELLTRLNGLDRGASESERFIDRLVTGAEEADFTMEQVFRLCDIEPEHCEEVFMALEHSVAVKSKPFYFIKQVFLILTKFLYHNNNANGYSYPIHYDLRWEDKWLISGQRK